MALVFPFLVVASDKPGMLLLKRTCKMSLVGGCACVGKIDIPDEGEFDIGDLVTVRFQV